MHCIVICGQTATGKSGLAVQLASQHNGEVISADSRQVYRGLDIGSNKITTAEMCGIPHWGLDIAEPGERYTVAQFQKYAREKIGDILSCGKTPIIVGGTGLYIDAVIFEGFEFGGETKKGSLDYVEARNFTFEKNLDLSHLGSQVRYSHSHDSVTPCEYASEDDKVAWIGLWAPRDFLVERIRARAESHVDPLLAEIHSLMESGIPRDWLHRLGLEYRYGTELLEGALTKQQYIELLTTKTWQYSRRQMTWFKRNPHITWHDISVASNSELDFS